MDLKSSGLTPQEVQPVKDAAWPAVRRDFGVLLLNMGGPDSLDGIEDYLRELFSDRDMIRLPLGKLYQNSLARFIAARRAPKVRERYAAIGGGSPLAGITRRQAAALQRELGRPVDYGMRYSGPRTAKAVTGLSRAGIERLVVLPLYPQFSHTTTGSALAELDRCGAGVPVTVIRDHHDDPGYIAAMAEGLRPYLEAWPGWDTARVLFVAHSLPLKYVRRGDSYVDQTRRTVALVARAAGMPDAGWRLAFSSRVGPVRWQGPSLEESLARLAAEATRHLVVVPVSFVAENLETLWDLDVVFREQCAAAGIPSFRRVSTLGDSPLYIEALARLARQAGEKKEMANG